MCMHRRAIYLGNVRRRGASNKNILAAVEMKVSGVGC